MNYELYLVFYEKEINDRRKFSIFSICSAPPISRAGMVSIADLWMQGFYFLPNMKGYHRFYTSLFHI